jgi:hypothetical protein
MARQQRFIITALALSILSPYSNADGTGPIAPLHKEDLRKAEIIVPRNIPGALLPWQTYQLDKTIDRPKYWNGYGVDPQGPNYYIYFDKYPCNYDFMQVEEKCRTEPIGVPNVVPEPSIIKLILVAIGCFLIVRLSIYSRKL